MKAQLDKLEVMLNDVFRKKVPWQLPESGRKGLAGALWWLALLFGILDLWAAYGFWRSAHHVNELVDWANSINAAYGAGVAEAHSLGLFFYLSLIVVAASGVLLLLAVPKLKAFSKLGWNLVFYSLVLNAVYGVVRVFSEYGGGLGALIWGAISTAIGAYFLFQVRDYFKSKSAASKPAK